MQTQPTFDDRDEAILGELVDALVARDEAIAALEAEQIGDLATALRIAHARCAHRPAATRAQQMDERSIAAEIAVARRMSDRTVQRHMNEALLLIDDFPATVDALAEGRITARHAAVIRDEATGLHDPDVRAHYEHAVLERAAGDTPAGTRAFAAKVAEQLHPRSITERHAVAVGTRRVWAEDLADGMSQLGVIAPSVYVHGMFDGITGQAKTIMSAAPDAAAAEQDGIVHDLRTLDQVRADLVCDLLLSGAPAIDPTREGVGGIRAQVSISVPALTAAGVHDRGATLDGTQPIDADTARRLLGGASIWQRVLTDPVSGQVLAVDGYRRTEAIKRFLRARDVHCRFPGCRQPAHRCDHDHSLDWARGGATDVCNLACLCKRHHTLKTEKPWKARQLADGTIVWTSPLGRETRARLEPYVAFRPDPDPPGAPPF